MKKLNRQPWAIFTHWIAVNNRLPASILLMLLLQVNAANAQPGDSTAIQKMQEYIKPMSDYIGVKVSANNAIEEFSVRADPVKYELYPNTSTITRINLNYRLLSFSYGFAPKFINGNDDSPEKGKTKLNSFGLGFKVGKFFNELSYSKTKGYYINNTKEVDPTWQEGDPYLQIPRLQALSFEGLTGYNFNRNFSQAAILTQTERQLKSAGSFIPKLFYRYFIIDDKSPGFATQKTNNFQVILGAGYHHSFVIRQKIYFSLGVTPGIGYIWTKLTTRYPTGAEIAHQRNWVLQWDARAGLGYNSDHLFGGCYLSALDNSYRQQHTTAVNENFKLRYQAFIGYRFNAPKKLVTTYDSMEQKMKRKMDKLQGKSE